MVTPLRRFPRYKPSQLPWLGDIPDHWSVRRLKTIADVTPSNVDKHTVAGERPVRLCNYVDVYKHDLITNAIDFMAGTASPEEVARFGVRAGDVIITKDSESWEDIAVSAFVPDELDEVVCGYHLALIRAKRHLIDGRYLFRAFGARGINDQFRVAANGITRFALGQDAIGTAVFPLPPLTEQRAIATFLDRETAQIDALIAKKERLLALLDEKRSALITRAVTKGLDPAVPMKESGVEWLGKVPAHWQVRRIKSFAQVKRGASPRPIEDPIYFDDEGECAWVRISDVTASDRYLFETEQRLSALGQSKSVTLAPGSLFLSIAATVGRPIITRIKCCIHDGFVYFVNLGQNSEFLYYVFRSGEPYKGLGKLGTQLNLNTDSVGSIIVPLPPLDEQASIVSWLDAECAKLDSLVQQITRAIVLLREYRTALISAAVTGQIDVSGGVDRGRGDGYEGLKSQLGREAS